MNLRDKTHGYWARLSGLVEQPGARFAALTVYYLGILVGLIVLYCKANYATPPFIYQNF
jgi:hypothetical protein